VLMCSRHCARCVFISLSVIALTTDSSVQSKMHSKALFLMKHALYFQTFILFLSEVLNAGSIHSTAVSIMTQLLHRHLKFVTCTFR